MLNQTFASQFIRKIRSQTDYNVNIMNEHGIIIASSSAERIGTFHAKAFQMIKNNIGVDITENISEALPGVTSPGVNLLLREGLTPIGVIGVSGEPESVLPLVKIIKLAFETFCEYEGQRNQAFNSIRTMGRFAQLLFADHPMNLIRVRATAQNMGIAENIDRYPLLIDYSGSEATDRLFDSFSKHFPSFATYSPNDLLFRIDSNMLLMYKSVDESTVSSFRKSLRECIREIDSWFTQRVPDLNNHYICGTVQSSFTYYDKSYEAVLWLRRYKYKKDMKIYFLADYLFEYMMTRLSPDEFAPILEIHAKIIKDNMDEVVFLETVGALIEANMNLNKAADMLFLHKNTVAARVKKIKELLDISPLTCVRDAVFLTAVYNYMTISDNVQ